MNRHESQRGYFSYALWEQMKKDELIRLVIPDLGYKIFDQHLEDYPDRCIQMGASEQLALGCAVGLAQEGLKPFVYSITPFLLSRPYEWIRNYVNHEQAPVRLVGSGRDTDYKHDGWSHEATDDMEILRPFTNIQILRPQDKSEIPEMVERMVTVNSAWYINLAR